MNKFEAAKARLFKYSNGKSCKKGHMPLRYTASGACVGCVADYAKRATRIRNEAIKAAQQGKIIVSIEIYAEHKQQLEEYVVALNFAHELSS